ncbi:MAG TPA: hypothetical protein HA362_00570 [Nanoarchaeota archaeon]|nr:hypothetical protein [Nanoarchaeota archaeon]
MKWFDDLFSALRQSYTMEDRKSFPFEIRDLPLAYKKLWLEKVMAAIVPVKDVKALAESFNSVNEIRVPFVELLKIARQEKHPQVNLLCDFFYKLAKSKVKNCPFSSDGKNIKYDSVGLKKILAETPFVKAIEPKKFGQLSAYLHMLAWNLHTDSFSGIYYHGPYKLEKGILIIREFFDLDCREIWPESEIPFKTITLLAIYNPMNIKMKFYTEMINDKNFNEELIEYAVIVDNKPLAEIDLLLKDVKEIANKQKSRLHTLEGVDMKKKFIEIQGFRLRHLFDAAGMDWKPESDMLYALAITEHVRKWDLSGMSRDEAFAKFESFLDPRK